MAGSDTSLLVGTMKSLGISVSIPLRDKVVETMRRLRNMLPNGSLSKAESCRSLISIEIACRVTKTPFDRTKLLAYSSIGEREYLKALTTCKAALNIKWNFTNVKEILSLKYSIDTVTHCEEILDQFGKRYIQNLPQHARGYVQLDSAMNICAAFFIASEKDKIKVDKNGLCKLAETSWGKLLGVVDHMRKFIECGDTVFIPASSNSRNTAIKGAGGSSSSSSSSSSGGSGFPPAQLSNPTGGGGVSCIGQKRNRMLELIHRTNAERNHSPDNLENDDKAATSSAGGRTSGTSVQKPRLVNNVQLNVLAAEVKSEPSLEPVTKQIQHYAPPPLAGAAATTTAAPPRTREAYEAWRDAKLEQRKRSKKCGSLH